VFFFAGVIGACVQLQWLAEWLAPLRAAYAALVLAPLRPTIPVEKGALFCNPVSVGML
jgi:hypothetical protein